MAVLPDSAALGEQLPVPQGSGGVASYQPPNFRQTGMAGTYISEGGRQIEQAANEMIHANAQQDALVAQDAANRLEQTRVQQQFDPKTGWANAKQGQAVGQQFIDQNTQKFADAQQQIRDGLTSEYQKKVFDQHAQGQEARFQAAIYSHQAQETDKYNSTVENSTINNTLASMARDPANELEFQRGILDINRVVEGAIDRRGLPASEADTLKRQYLVAAYGTRIDSIARGVPGGAPADPKSAQAMLAQVWDKLGPAGPKIWDSLHSAVQTVDAKNQGGKAFTNAVSTLAAPAMPRAIPGSPDKPLDAGSLGQIAKFVQTPSPWEKDILAAAQATGVNPAEIKLKIGLESRGNPGAVNGETGATGLGQFMPATAAQYGVTDRADPVQSIWGIARFLKAHGGTNGASMDAADRAYIGNPDRTNPNTDPKMVARSDQYVENTRAARQAAIGGGGGQTNVTSAQLEGLEGQIVKNAETSANVDAPNDPALRDKYVMEARRQLNVALTSARGQEYQQYTSVLDTAMSTGAQAQSDLPRDIQGAYDQLPPQRKEGIDAAFRHNAALARGEFMRSDPKVFNDLQQRIYLPDSDPRKITRPDQLFDAMGKGLADAGRKKLESEIKDAQNPEGNLFVKSVADARKTGRSMLTAKTFDGSGVADKFPDLADEAAFRFSADLDKKIEAYRKAGKDPQLLLTSGTPDYVLTPEKVQAFMPTEKEIVARKAQAAAKPAAGLSKVTSDADFNALPPGAFFISPDGHTRQKPS